MTDAHTWYLLQLNTAASALMCWWTLLHSALQEIATACACAVPRRAIPLHSALEVLPPACACASSRLCTPVLHAASIALLPEDAWHLNC